MLSFGLSDYHQDPTEKSQNYYSRHDDVGTFSFGMSTFSNYTSDFSSPATQKADSASRDSFGETSFPSSSAFGYTSNMLNDSYTPANYTASTSAAPFTCTSVPSVAPSLPTPIVFPPIPSYGSTASASSSASANTSPSSVNPHPTPSSASVAVERKKKEEETTQLPITASASSSSSATLKVFGDEEYNSKKQVTASKTIESDANTTAAFRRRCKNCSEWYTSPTATPCYFHPGFFTEPDARKQIMGVAVGWSCCRYRSLAKKELNPNAMQFHSRGCVLRGCHEEDVAVSRALANFPIRHDEKPLLPAPSVSASSTIDSVDEIETSVGKGGKPVAAASETPGAPNDNFIRHEVRSGETLSGLAIRYGVSEADIQRVNQMFGGARHLITKKTLLIPVVQGFPLPGPPRDEAAIARSDTLRSLTRQMPHLTNEEAKFYLEENRYDLAAALKQAKDDLNWEKHHKPQQRK